jgi:alpha-L-rhamnosidase
MMGSIDAWFYKYISGIQLNEDNPAYAVFTVKPTILKGLEFANAELETIKGTVSSSWKKEAGKFVLNVEVPFNTRANVFVPGPQSAELMENGDLAKDIDGLKYIEYSNGAHQIQVHSGRYSFTIDLN